MSDKNNQSKLANQLINFPGTLMIFENYLKNLIKYFSEKHFFNFLYFFAIVLDVHLKKTFDFNELGFK